jgi:hypothetical protein
MVPTAAGDVRQGRRRQRRRRGGHCGNLICTGRLPDAPRVDDEGDERAAAAGRHPGTSDSRGTRNIGDDAEGSGRLIPVPTSRIRYRPPGLR